MAGYVDAFEEASLLREFIMVLDYVDSTLAVVERCRPPSAIARMLAYDGPQDARRLRQGIPRTCRKGDGPCAHGAAKPTLRSPRR
jgi:hypothetical protein